MFPDIRVVASECHLYLASQNYNAFLGKCLPALHSTMAAAAAVIMGDVPVLERESSDEHSDTAPIAEEGKDASFIDIHTRTKKKRRTHASTPYFSVCQKVVVTEEFVKLVLEASKVLSTQKRYQEAHALFIQLVTRYERRTKEEQNALYNRYYCASCHSCLYCTSTCRSVFEVMNRPTYPSQLNKQWQTYGMQLFDHSVVWAISMCPY